MCSLTKPDSSESVVDNFVHIEYWYVGSVQTWEYQIQIEAASSDE